ncbi:hypothetical protein [Flavobacterium pectinovorum]|uniref:Immunity protein 44 n=1 Tax=Flavobacterium pectinovorum TaxID=29533 RepID=A0A502DZA0_9FLAO|nr:hypothetical protein [Flavobacterium pectinovorum]TPG29772.1 hypothetical protein EAH81_27450 [Flavobacterium pectinovorum]
MRFSITSDTNYETKVSDQVTTQFPAREVEDWLYFKNYGDDLVEIFIVLMCRSPEYNFKQRIRMDRKNKILYIDLMLDYHYFVSNINQDDRINNVANKIINEIPPIIKKYKLKDFNVDLFMKDLKDYLKKISWL